MSSTKAPRTLHFDEAATKLSSLTSNLELVKYVPGCNKLSTFLIVATSQLIYYQFGSLLNKLRSNSAFIPRSTRLTHEIASKKLALASSKYELLEFIPGKKSLSLFRDVDGNREVRGNFNNLVQNLKRNPDYILNPTQAQLSDIRRTAAFKISPPIFTRPEVRFKVVATRVSRGLTKVVEGETLPQMASRLGISYATVQQAFKNNSVDDAIQLCEHKKVYTALELPIKKYLDSNEISYTHNKKLKGTTYRPDFVLEEHKIIIECDGLYWHSDVYRDKNYHSNKRLSYIAAGYRPFFFRGDELKSKLPIILSILDNAIALNSRKIGARKTSVVDTDSSFFVAHHLMGKGSGRCYGLVHGSELVAAMQVRRVPTGLDISRYCSLPDMTVQGGFTKLLSHISKIYAPSSIQTFIDLRYGSGIYLEGLGFRKKTCYNSFKWTDYSTTVHRLKHRGNSGYADGLRKIWDCGQAKYIKHMGIYE